MAITYEVFGDVVIVNCTPHPVSIQDMDGNVRVVPNSPEHLINASACEQQVAPLFVKTEFVGTPEGEEKIREIREWFFANFNSDHSLVIVGSIIAAQAYPGMVFGLCPVPGYERVSPAEKRMRCDKFTTF